MASADDHRRLPPWTWDELVLVCQLVVDNRWRRLPATDQRVHDLSDLLRTSSIHRLDHPGPKFRNPSGVELKTRQLATNHPDHPHYGFAHAGSGWLGHAVIRAFTDDPHEMSSTAAALRRTLRTAGPVAEALQDLDLDTDPSEEGRLLERLHLVRERNPTLRARKIKNIRARLGQVCCEVCNFDFEQVYGPRGRDYVECHHRTPLSHSSLTKTALADLALLCSNCHRMIHRKRPWITIEELRGLVSQSTR